MNRISQQDPRTHWWQRWDSEMRLPGPTKRSHYIFSPTFTPTSKFFFINPHFSPFTHSHTYSFQPSLTYFSPFSPILEFFFPYSSPFLTPSFPSLTHSFFFPLHSVPPTSFFPHSPPISHSLFPFTHTLLFLPLIQSLRSWPPLASRP